MSKSSITWNYTYDANGMRTSRSNGTKTYNYVYNGSQLTQMTVGNDTLYFTYGALGPTTVTWNGTTYYYALNGQGDVTGIFDGNGNLVVLYNWDNAWGYNPAPEGSLASTLGTLNPLRYRGYVYDSETGYYYLQSRYYDPEIGRFINADALVATGQGLLGNNMFAYCGNNPVNNYDPSGHMMVPKKDLASYGGASLLALSVLLHPNVAETAVEVVSEALMSIEETLCGNSVYVLKDDAGTVQYVGRTNNIERREKAHKANPARTGLHMEVVASGLTLPVARALEQAGMAYYHTINTKNKMNNQINGIAPKYWGEFQVLAMGLIDYGWNQMTNEILYWAGS